MFPYLVCKQPDFHTLFQFNVEFKVRPFIFQGMPDWAQIAKELPEMEALLSKLER